MTPSNQLNMTVMMGGASTMYVSQNNIYVTYPTWTNGGQYTDNLQSQHKRNPIDI